GGGLFVTVGGNAAIPIDFGITEGVSIQDARALQARGSIMNASFADRKSPIAYGYDEKLAVYFNQAPLLQVGGGGLGGVGGGGGGGGGRGGGGGGGGAAGAFGGGGFGQGQGRSSGRGGVNDPDVIQGRRPVTAQAPATGEDGVPPEIREQLAANQPPPEMRP